MDDAKSATTKGLHISTDNARGAVVIKTSAGIGGTVTLGVTPEYAEARAAELMMAAAELRESRGSRGPVELFDLARMMHAGEHAEGPEGVVE